LTLAQELSIENGELTPSLKVKRSVVAEHLQQRLAEEGTSFGELLDDVRRHAARRLAALVALRSRDGGIPQPALQVLLYPALDLSAETQSRTLFSDGFFLSKRDSDWLLGLYLNGATGEAVCKRRCRSRRCTDIALEGG
jgi:alpha/beta hydrolase fold